MDKLKMHSPDLTQDNIAKIRELFPGCVKEAADKNGNLRYAVDFDQLRQELSDQIVEGPQERYRLDWPGKREALLAANAPIAKTLRPCREESVDFDTTRNLFIEGDNLEALKLLQHSFLGGVDVIYIDPPYNTGKDFIYSDNFADTAQAYFLRSNQVSEVGDRLIANTEANGRMHSEWLSMLYSRLKISRNLLSNTGVLFVSINHKEVANLRRILDEIFDEKNLLCMFAWRTDGNFDNQAKFKYCHEYVLAYAKSEEAFPAPEIVDPSIPKKSKIYKDEIRNTIIKNGPKNPISELLLPVGFPAGFEKGEIDARQDKWPHLSCKAVVESFKLTNEVRIKSGWSSKELFDQFIKNSMMPVLDAKGQLTRFELMASGAIEAVKIRGKPSHVISVLTGFGGPQKATAEIEKLDVIFDDYPKPLDLLKYLIMMNSKENLHVMDFFAGSASTAHAVFELNASDSRSRRFTLIQLPELVSKDSQAHSEGFRTISEISKRRIKNAAKKVSLSKAKEADQDFGFRVLKIDSSNMIDTYYTPEKTEQAALLDAVENIKPDRTDPEDLLFQVLVDWGVDLTLPIRRETIDGKTVLFVNEEPYDLIACFDRGISEALVKQLAAYKPNRVVFRDNGFATDAVKINAEQIFKQLSPHTKVRAI